MSKKCPHCGSTKITCAITKKGFIDFAGEEPAILKEGNAFTYEVIGCANKNCPTKTDASLTLTEADLVSDEKCSECGKEGVELIGGLCLDCLLKNRKDLKGLSQAGLIKKIMETEEKANIKTSKVEKKADAEEVVPKTSKKDEVKETDEADEEDTEEDDAKAKAAAKRKATNAKKKAAAAKKKADEEAAKIVDEDDGELNEDDDDSDEPF